MRKFTRMTLIAATASLAMAGQALAQADSVSVTLDQAFAKEAAKLGERDVQQQLDELTRTVERTLLRREALHGAKVDLIVTDLKPNRPTMQQLSAQPGLDAMRSLSIGGAAFEGTVTLADGSVQPVKYEYYTPTIRDSRGATTWSDASRAYDRLARNLAEGRFSRP